MKTYLVTWKIEIDAKNAKDAAKQALTIQRDCDSTATIFDVREPNGNNVTFDLLPKCACKAGSPINQK